MILKTIIIDDEKNNIENLSILLNKYCPQAEVIASASNAADGIDIILENAPDLVFLDIKMPEMDGFEMLKSLNAYSFEIIFVTAYDNYAIQAVRFSAIDYLVKPINTHELINAVQRAEQRSFEKGQNLQLNNLMDFIKQKDQKQLHRIALQSARETRFVEPSRITRCESSNNYTTIYISGGEKFLTSKPIFEYEQLLSDYGFFRCHQSHLVNKKYIKSWVKEDGGYLLMDDESQVPVSRNNREKLKNELT